MLLLIFKKYQFKKLKNMTIQITKSQVEKMIEEDFLSSADISDEIKRQIENKEAELDVNDLDLVTIEHMRADACGALVSTLDDLEEFGLYTQKAGYHFWNLFYFSRDKNDVLDELKRIAENEAYDHDQTYYRIFKSGNSRLTNKEAHETSSLI